MKESGMVPLFYHPDINVAKAVLKACYDGGARLMEFTNRGDFAIAIFTDLIKYAIAELPGMMLGVGSVFHERQVCSCLLVATTHFFGECRHSLF